jgi:hypothetical protein
MNTTTSHNLILPKYLKGKGGEKGGKFQKRAHGRVGQAFLSLYFLFWKW